MLTIAGSGMSQYDLTELAERISLSRFRTIVLDQNYARENNATILDSLRERIVSGSFLECRHAITEHLRQDPVAPLLYIVTGSPLFYSGASSVLDHLEKELPGFRREEAEIVDAPSSLETLLHRLRLDKRECLSLSLHGREEADLALLLRRKYTFLLCDDRTPGRLGELLAHLEEGVVTLFMGSRLGYPEERVFSLSLHELADLSPEQIRDLSPFSLLLRRNAPLPPFAPGTEEYHHDAGMITKPLKRGIALRELALEPNQLLWDVGAGSGSVSIEAHLRHRVRTVLFEKNGERLSNIRRNLERHAVLAATVLEGDAMENLPLLEEDPHRIFVGGGGEAVARGLPLLYDRLRPNGILVVFYVALSHLSRALQSLEEAKIPHSVTSLSLNHFSPGEPRMGEGERMLFILKSHKPASA